MNEENWIVGECGPGDGAADGWTGYEIRRAGGNEEAEVVTVVDTALPGFASLTEAFHNWEDVWRQTP